MPLRLFLWIAKYLVSQKTFVNKHRRYTRHRPRKIGIGYLRPVPSFLLLDKVRNLRGIPVSQMLSSTCTYTF